MTETLRELGIPPAFPDHTQLPESDGTFVKNFEEHPQSLLLTETITPVLQQLHPDGQYAIGQDSGIYWRETEPPERGAEAPDWFYVPDVPPRLDGQIRRSYVLWREYTQPLIALEFASGDGSEERDNTPLAKLTDKTQKPGKFWVYSRIIRIPYYGIYSVMNGSLEMFHLTDFTYYPMTPDAYGHYPIPQMQVAIGIWQGVHLNYPEQPWLRWWDLQGNLLLTGREQVELERLRTEQERQRAEQERQRAEQERRRADLLAAYLREQGIDPDSIG